MQVSLKPVYAGDTITVYLTGERKINRGVKGEIFQVEW